MAAQVQQLTTVPNQTNSPSLKINISQRKQRTCTMHSWFGTTRCNRRSIRMHATIGFNNKWKSKRRKSRSDWRLCKSKIKRPLWSTIVIKMMIVDIRSQSLGVALKSTQLTKWTWKKKKWSKNNRWCKTTITKSRRKKRSMPSSIEFFKSEWTTT